MKKQFVAHVSTEVFSWQKNTFFLAKCGRASFLRKVAESAIIIFTSLFRSLSAMTFSLTNPPRPSLTPIRLVKPTVSTAAWSPMCLGVSSRVINRRKNRKLSRLRLDNAKHSFELVTRFTLLSTVSKRGTHLADSQVFVHSKEKLLTHVICLWLPLCRTLSISERPLPNRRSFQLFRTWRPHFSVQNVRRQSCLWDSTKFSKPLSTIEIDDAAFP